MGNKLCPFPHILSPKVIHSSFPCLSPWPLQVVSQQQLLHTPFTFLFSFQITANVLLGDKEIPLSRGEASWLGFPGSVKLYPKQNILMLVGQAVWLSVMEDPRFSSPFQSQMNEGTCFIPNWVWLWIHNTLFSSIKDLYSWASLKPSSTSNTVRKLHLTFHFPLFVSSQILQSMFGSPEVWWNY